MKDLINSNTNDLKRCKACSEHRPLSSYYPKGKGRVDAICKSCMGKLKAKKRKVVKQKEKQRIKIGKVEIRLVPVIEHII